ncbi:tetratricopeptide repeat protein [Nonomuraea basaltis]|uniref:tetratricopeptide repeat protein n=1 Tax=Nonomuraea basaltis TaxID=2495887 RepID=UPI00148659A4|nr:tetratricopeptide repeat protein [Nonomuraea basaltis]
MRARQWGLTLAGVAVTVGGGVATNQVDGPGWVQAAWYAGAMVCLAVGPWLTLRASARSEVVQQPRRDPGGQVIAGDIPRAPVALQRRSELMALLEAAGDSDQPVAVGVLVGAPGVGKTQIAAAYARVRVQHGWPLVAWVHAESRDLFLAEMQAVAVAVGITVQGEDSEQAARRLKEWLGGRRERCLLVLDNLTDARLAAEWLPSVGAAQIVITSNLRQAGAMGTVVPVSGFTREEAVTFLRERSGRDDEEGALELADELDGLPLALAQAAGVIRSQHLDYATYLQRLRSVPLEKMLPPIPAEGYSHGAAQAALLSLTRLGRKRKTKTERGLLDLLAVLSPAGVRRSWLRGANAYMALVWFKGDAPLEIDTALGVLADASIVTMSMDGSSVGMHRLLQRVVCDAARKERRFDQIVISAALLVRECAPPGDGAVVEPAEREAFVDQVAALRGNAFSADSGASQGTLLLILSLQERAARLLDMTGDLKRALPVYEQIAADSEQVLGSDDYRTLVSRSEFADALAQAWERERAIPLFEQAAADFERVLGPEAPDSVAALSALARAYHQFDDLERAIPLFERAATAYERVLGPDDRNTLVSLNELARACADAGDTERAILLHEEAHAGLVRVQGPDHRDTLVTQMELGRASYEAGNCGRAIPLLEQTVAAMVRALGADDEATLNARDELARAHQGAGDVEAEC